MIHKSTNCPWDRPLEYFYVISALHKDSQTQTLTTVTTHIFTEHPGLEKDHLPKNLTTEGVIINFISSSKVGSFAKKDVLFDTNVKCAMGIMSPPNVTTYLGETGSNIYSTDLGERQRLAHKTPAKVIASLHNANTNQSR